MSTNNLIHASAMKSKSIFGNLTLYLNKLHTMMLAASEEGRYFIKVPSSEIIQPIKEQLTRIGYKVTHHMEEATITWEN